MATHRYREALVVLATSGALIVSAAFPAQAVTAPAAEGTQVSSSAGVGTAKARAVARRLAVTQPGATTRLALARTAQARTQVQAARAAAERARRAAAAAAAAAEAARVAAAAEAARVAAAAEAARIAAAAAAAPTTVVPSLLANSPSGQAAPRGDLPGWKQTYVEDFATDVATGSFPGAYSDHWYAYADGVKDTSKNGTYMPSQVLSVHDGVMDYAISTKNGVHQVSAPVVKDTYGQVYGRYSVRFRSDSLPGYKNAWLLWPDSERWPDHGEIDFPEGDLDGSINGFAHYAAASGGQDAFSTGASFLDWHTATIEWLPGKVTFLLDGKVIGTSTRNVPATAMHWVLQTETALSGGAPAAGVSGHVLVDWVALWTRA